MFPIYAWPVIFQRQYDFSKLFSALLIQLKSSYVSHCLSVYSQTEWSRRNFLVFAICVGLISHVVRNGRFPLNTLYLGKSYNL